MNHLSVRDIEPQDVPHIIAYWQQASPEYLRGIGADIALLPDFESWSRMLQEQIAKPFREKSSYCIIWLHDDVPVGHSNVNNIVFGKEAYMHLHLWNQTLRQSGIGLRMLQQAIPRFFKNLELQTLYCEPYALNPAPNRTLEKLGFTRIKEYVTTPGFINFEQPVIRWQMTLQAAALLPESKDR